MKTKLFAIAVLIICLLGLNVIGAAAQEPVPNRLTIHLMKGNKTGAYLISQGENNLPWAGEIIPQSKQYKFAVSAGDGFFIFAVKLVAILHIQPTGEVEGQPTCYNAIWRLPCPGNDGTVYQVLGSIKFSNAQPKVMLVSYDSVTLRISSYPDRGPAIKVCEAAESSKYVTCFKQLTAKK